MEGSKSVMETRQAQCYCGKTKPSDESLPFFESRDTGSKQATIGCKNCFYYEVAHGKGHKQVCNNFIPHGAYEYDTFYCGCDGWE